jgi:DNA-binding NarL/FixJ family response regulator
MVALLVVEDHALVREGLVLTLRQVEPETVVLEAPDANSASALLAQGNVFDLILLDLGLPGIDGLSYLATLRKRYPTQPVVILSAFDDPHTIDKALESGAAGFVPKSFSSERLLDAVREVLAGKVFRPGRPDLAALAPSPRSPIRRNAKPEEFGLTERQAEVLALMASGKSNRSIAELLGLTEGTVKIHMTAIFKALGVASRTQAMVVVARQKIRL